MDLVSRAEGAAKGAWLVGVALALAVCEGSIGGNGGGAGGEAGSAGALGGSAGQGGLGAFGGSGGQGGFEVPQEHLDDCAAWAPRFCELYFDCMEPFAIHDFGTEADCETRTNDNCVELYRPGLTLGWGQACAEALTGDCLQFKRLMFDGPAAPTTPPECFPPGKLLDGSQCNTADQCQSFNCAWPDEEAGCGTCTQPPSLHDSCVSGCGPGLRCMDSVCVVPGDVSDSCTITWDCLIDLWCKDNLCTATADLWEPCEPNEVWSCSFGEAFCNPLKSKCNPIKPGQPMGERCSFSDDGDFWLCDHGVCVPTESDPQLFVCQAPKQLGEECSTDVAQIWGQDCDWMLSCIDGTCQTRDDYLTCD